MPYNPMLKNQLEAGMIIKFNNGKKHLISRDKRNKLYSFGDDNKWMNIEDELNEYLVCPKHAEYTVDFVYETKKIGSLKEILENEFDFIELWKRPAEIRLTIEEITDKFSKNDWWNPKSKITILPKKVQYDKFDTYANPGLMDSMQEVVFEGRVVKLRNNDRYFIVESNNQGIITKYGIGLENRKIDLSKYNKKTLEAQGLDTTSLFSIDGIYDVIKGGSLEDLLNPLLSFNINKIWGRKHKNPVTMQEIAKEFNIDESEIDKILIKGYNTTK